jgi:GDPmannose 4,6-dehydratase
MKKALIIGLSGQDGAYLSRYLLQKGYKVFGSSRDCHLNSFENLSKLGIKSEVEKISVSPSDYHSVFSAIKKIEPDEIYNLSGQTSVGVSFDQPLETLQSVEVGCLNLLESIKIINSKIRLYNAGSGEMFGDTGRVRATESTPFNPSSPYAIAKAAAAWHVKLYRQAYGLFASTGILFNHESPLRPSRFVTRKIVSTACRIHQGSNEKLRLGNIEIIRDWGWAPEYVEAMWLMNNCTAPDDFVIATGESNSLKDFIECVFGLLSLNWRDFVEFDTDFVRPTENIYSGGNPAKARQVIGWDPRMKMREIIKLLVDAELREDSVL